MNYQLGKKSILYNIIIYNKEPLKNNKKKYQETYEQLMIDIQGKHNEIHSLQTLIQQLQFLDQKVSL